MRVFVYLGLCAPHLLDLEPENAWLEIDDQRSTFKEKIPSLKYFTLPQVSTLSECGKCHFGAGHVSDDRPALS